MTFVRIPRIATIWDFSAALEFSSWPEAEGVTFGVSSNMRGQHFDRAVLVFFSPGFPRGIDPRALIFQAATIPQAQERFATNYLSTANEKK